MIQGFRDRYQQFHASFHDSEVILWARLQFLFFAFYTALQTIDINQFITDKRMMQIYILINGVVGEYARRRREEWKDPGK